MCAVLVAWADDGDSAVESVRAGADVRGRARAIRAVSDMPYRLRRILQVCDAGGSAAGSACAFPSRSQRRCKTATAKLCRCSPPLR
ncbi:hypothetical protein XAP6164_3370007 [Xanthomonas phaseoli pv. phaseoli]|uniref:Transposase n=1 Tax=Xanthomonas campestris pv. phaseoli TaxID=317013 RepID=A0ABY1TXL7_XANCH|nr:hypothetical protein XAP6984_830067 [Xanthomonas phaseoli pv. phaseoli]SOO29490.1 hypothetical protein XAP6164_3370007 [Xanthomonas phaseoli pv. phaseoli]